MNEQILDALKRAHYRVLTGPEELEELYRLRYRSYLREGTIAANDSEMMSDVFDGSESCVNVGVEMDGSMRAAVRIHVLSKDFVHSPTESVFPEVGEMVNKGLTVLDPTRFVVDPDARQQRVPLHFLALRIPVLAAIFYDVDVVLAPVRPEHAAFYTRYLGHQKMIDARPYLGLTKPLQLMTTDVGENRRSILARTPALGPVPSLPQSDIAFPALPGAVPMVRPGSSDAA